MACMAITWSIHSDEQVQSSCSTPQLSWTHYTYTQYVHLRLPLQPPPAKYLSQINMAYNSYKTGHMCCKGLGEDMQSCDKGSTSSYLLNMRYKSASSVQQLQCPYACRNELLLRVGSLLTTSPPAATQEGARLQCCSLPSFCCCYCLLLRPSPLTAAEYLHLSRAYVACWAIAAVWPKQLASYACCCSMCCCCCCCCFDRLVSIVMCLLQDSKELGGHASVYTLPVVKGPSRAMGFPGRV